MKKKGQDPTHWGRFSGRMPCVSVCKKIMTRSPFHIKMLKQFVNYIEIFYYKYVETVYKKCSNNNLNH